jgi:hypothetical protein
MVGSKVYYINVQNYTDFMSEIFFLFLSDTIQMTKLVNAVFVSKSNSKAKMLLLPFLFHTYSILPLLIYIICGK